MPEGRFAIEQGPACGIASERGVVAEGSVGIRAAGRLRLFRYEVRRWRDGVIADAAEAVESPQRLSEDTGHARRLLELVPEMPTPVWGRDELRTGRCGIRTHSSAGCSFGAGSTCRRFDFRPAARARMARRAGGCATPTSRPRLLTRRVRRAVTDTRARGAGRRLMWLDALCATRRAPRAARGRPWHLRGGASRRRASRAGRGDRPRPAPGG
jgi:hypothetical protein